MVARTGRGFPWPRSVLTPRLTKTDQTAASGTRPAGDENTVHVSRLVCRLRVAPERLGTGRVAAFNALRGPSRRQYEVALAAAKGGQSFWRPSRRGVLSGLLNGTLSHSFT